MGNRPLCIIASLFVDIKRFDPDLRDLDRDLLTIEHRVEYEGISFLTNALPAFGLAFDRGLAKRCLEHIPGFARNRGRQIPKFLSGIVSRVFDESTGHLKQDYDMSCVKSVRQILYLFKKFGLSEESTDALDVKAKTKFFSTDDELVGLQFDDTRTHYLKMCCQTILPNLELDSEYSFKHGPGAVAEGHLSNSKWGAIWKSLCSTDDLSGLGLDLFGLNSERFQSETKDVQPSIPRGRAKLISVAKNSTSRRTITIEPVVLQFVQQGLNDALRREIEQCKILRQCLVLSQQRPNQHLAEIGSLTGEWATLDLSSASDRLSSEVVKLVFHRHGAFLEKLFRFRSVEVRAGQKPAQSLTKFAGMGNATTFPVQSVVFAMITIASILHKLGKSPTHRNVMHASRMVQVYGDDIICPTHHHSQVEEWLEHFGMRVNRHKSFTEGNFRESCGVDAFNGIDVTPLYLKYDPYDPNLEADFVGRTVEFSNHAWWDCYYSLAEAILEPVRRRIKHLPLKEDEDGFVGLTNRWNARTYTHWSKRYQRALTRAHVIGTRKHRDPIDGWPALLKSLLTPLLGRPVGHLEKVSKKYDTRLVIATL
jgi:hypothetical protein